MAVDEIVKKSIVDSFKAERESDDRAVVINQVMKKFIGTKTEEYERITAMRASQVFSVCIREVVFTNTLPLPEPVTTTDNLAGTMRMDTGSFLHWYFQNIVLGPMGVLKGTWVLYEDGIKMAKRVGYHPNNEIPSSWLSHSESPTGWFYQEITVGFPDLRLTGHIDGEVCMNRMKEFNKTGVPIKHDAKIVEDLALLEIKSTDDNTLRDIKDRGTDALSAGYKCQATVYQKATERTKTLFLYVDRKYFGFHSFEYSGEEEFWDLVVTKCMTLWACLENKILPPRCDECIHKLSKRAKECVYKEHCFKEGIEDSLWGSITT